MSLIADELGAAAMLTEASDAFGETVSITRGSDTASGKAMMFNSDRTRVTIRQALYNFGGGGGVVDPARGDFYTDSDGRVYTFSPSSQTVDGVQFEINSHFITETSEWQIPVTLREP